MEIHQLISKLQTLSNEEIHYKVCEMLGKSATSEIEHIYESEIKNAVASSWKMAIPVRRFFRLQCGYAKVRGKVCCYMAMSEQGRLYYTSK